MKKTILFDLDGTLTDSAEGIIKSATFAFEHYGRPVPPLEELKTFIGPPLHDSFHRNGFSEEELDDVVAVFRSRYVPIGMFENTPYPGIPQFLETLKAEGYALYVATSKPEGTAIEILKHFDLTKYFVRICGASEDTSRSTKDAVIAYLLKQVGSPDDMVMIGDTRFDILGAKEFGIPGIGVSWGYGKVQDMVDAGAIGIAHTLDELLDMLHKD